MKQIKHPMIRLIAALLCVVISGNQMTSDVLGGTPWYKKSKYITHACGKIAGYSYTNSKEALQQSIKSGDKLIEIDFMYTKEGALVCRHGLTKRPAYNKFIQSKIKGKFTPMTAMDALKIIGSKKGVYLVVDTKEKSSTSVYRRLVQTCKYLGRKDLLNRIVVQVYNRNAYYNIKKIYKFKNWIFTVYKYKTFSRSRCKSIAKFCKKNKIPVITVPTKWATKTNGKIIRRYGRRGYVHTVNTKSKLRKVKSRKFSSVYTDQL